MKMKWLTYTIATVGLWASWTPQLHAQSVPVDLTEISLEDLLKVDLLSSSTEASASPAPGWRVGYQYVHATFDGYKSGTRSLSFEEVLTAFPVVPTEITQRAHIIVVRRNLGEHRYLSAHIPYIQQETDHIRRMGDPFTIRTEGLGDIAAGYTWAPWQEGPHRIWFNAGLRLPTGSIIETGDTPRGRDTKVPYTMQLGSGTFDATPGITYLRSGDRNHFGASVNGLIRMGRNSERYSLSDRLNLAIWMTHELSSMLEASIKVEGKTASRIDGADPELDPTVAAVANPRLYGGDRVDVLGGITATLRGADREYTLRAEAGVPIYQDLNGPQPKLIMECTVYLGTTF